MYSFEFDARGRFWYVRCEGFWSLAEANRYCEEIERVSGRARASIGSARFLIDITGHGVQSAEVMECLDRVPRAIIRTPDDRIAVVQTPGLGMIQIRRKIKSAQTRLFESGSEARQWLAGLSLVTGGQARAPLRTDDVRQRASA